MSLLKRLNDHIAKRAYEAADKRTPVKLGDIVRHNLTRFDGTVIAIQYLGLFKPKCLLTVTNGITGRFISNIDRNEFTIADKLNLIYPSIGY